MTPGLSDGRACRERRWQSETDTLNQYPEVEASSIDEGNVPYTDLSKI